MDGEELFSLLDSTGKVEWTKFTYCWISSNGVKYRASHPQEYSKLPLKNADELAQKFQCNIITAHEHHLGKTWDRYQRYVVVNGGCMEDQSKAAYTRLRDNNKPNFHPGFVLLKDGVAEELSHYPYTNWDRWLRRDN